MEETFIKEVGEIYALWMASIFNFVDVLWRGCNCTVRCCIFYWPLLYVYGTGLWHSSRIVIKSYCYTFDQTFRLVDTIIQCWKYYTVVFSRTILLGHFGFTFYWKHVWDRCTGSGNYLGGRIGMIFSLFLNRSSKSKWRYSEKKTTDTDSISKF